MILFSDILTPLPGVGVSFEIDDNKGPLLDDPIRSAEQVRCLAGCLAGRLAGWQAGRLLVLVLVAVWVFACLCKCAGTAGVGLCAVWRFDRHTPGWRPGPRAPLTLRQPPQRQHQPYDNRAAEEAAQARPLPAAVCGRVAHHAAQGGRRHGSRAGCVWDGGGAQDGGCAASRGIAARWPQLPGGQREPVVVAGARLPDA